MATWTSQRTGNWSDDATNVTSPWNGGGNPASGVPGNTDTVTIAAGHDVAYDYDMTGFANGITLVITGTLHASTTAGSYVLRLAANMTGAGTLRAGTSGTPYPDNCTIEIQRNGFEITATNMALDLNCSEPAVKYCKLTGVEAAGQTVLSVDTDLTSYTAHWKDGAIVRICDVNFGNDNEERVIAAGGIAATTITITAGLTAQKETGAYIVLISRNVKITHSATTGNAISGGSGGTINAEIRGASTGIGQRQSATIGGTVSNYSTGLGSPSGSTISAAIIGGTTGINTGNGITINSTGIIGGNTNSISGGSGGLIFGIIICSASGIINSTAFLIYGDIVGCATGISGGGGHKLVNSHLSNSTDLANVAQSNLYNVLMSGAAEFNGYNGASVPINNFVDSINHDQQAGAYKAWTKGGIVAKQAIVFPTGYTSSQQHACESATYYCFQNYSLTVPAGGGLVVQCYVQKDALMSYLPRVWILLPGVEPFISGSPSYEAIMAADSISTWESLGLVYANATTAPVTVTVRTVAKNATGNAYFYPINTVLAPATYDVYNTLQADLDNIQTRLPAALVSGRMDSNVGAMASNTITASALATDAVTEIQVAIFAGLMEGKTFEEFIKDIWAQTVGDFVADDAADPTSITYDGPNGAVQITHTLTDTTRTVS